MKPLIAAAGVLLLTVPALAGSFPSWYPTNKVLLSAMAAFGQADHAAGTYANLPACDPPTLAAHCSDTATVAALRPLFSDAQAALAAAKASPESTPLASAALAAAQRLQAAIPLH